MGRRPQHPTGPDVKKAIVKKALAVLDTETLALGLSIAWLLLVQLLAVLAWEAELLTRQGALLHWLAVGVLPPALALWTLPPGQTPRR
jgi:hypothetical protein